MSAAAGKPVWHTWQVTQWIYEVPGLTATEQSVALALAQRMDRHNRTCWPSQATIATAIRRKGKNTGPISRALRGLEDKGVIYRTPRYLATRKRTTDIVHIRVPEEVAWREHQGQADLAQFDHDGDDVGNDPHPPDEAPHNLSYSPTQNGEEPNHGNPYTFEVPRDSLSPNPSSDAQRGSCPTQNEGPDDEFGDGLPTMEQVAQLQSSIDAAKAASSLRRKSHRGTIEVGS